MGSVEARFQNQRTVDRRMAKEQVEKKLYIVDRKYEEVLGYPTLFESKHEGRFVKFDPLSGAVWTSSWVNSKVKPQEIDKAKYRVVSGRWTNAEKVVLQRWQGFDNIETAARAADHIYEKYVPQQGTVARKNDQLIDFANELLVEFNARPLDDDRLQDLYTLVESNLPALGLTSAMKLIKVQIAQQLRAATQEDSLGRVNSLVSRTRVASAWLKAIQESFFNMKVENKYSRSKFVLESERNLERFYIERVLIYAERIYDLNLADPTSVAKVRELQAFSETFLSPASIRVAPYRIPALLFTDSLFGFINPDANRLTKKLKVDLGLVTALYEIPRENFKERLFRGTVLLRQALQQGEDNQISSGRI